jgi:hypothetical protein
MCSVTTPNSQNIQGFVKVVNITPPYCKVDCKPVTLDTGTTASIDDGVNSGTTGSCDFTCALSPADTNARVDKVNTNGVRSCTKTCTSGSMTTAGICCLPVTAASGITVTYNSGDCGFTCTVSDPQRPVIVDTAARTCTLANYCNPIYISPSDPAYATAGSQIDFIISSTTNVCIRAAFPAYPYNYNYAPPGIYSGSNKMIIPGRTTGPYPRDTSVYKRVYSGISDSSYKILVPASSTTQVAAPITTYMRSVRYCPDGYWLYFNNNPLFNSYYCYATEFLNTMSWITRYYDDPNTSML